MDTAQTRRGPCMRPSATACFEPGIEAAGVADGGVARRQRGLDGPGGLQVRQGRRFLDLPTGYQAIVLVGQVVMGIDEAGQECEP